MPLQVNSCVYFTRSEIVALSGHLVFASLPQSLFILLLCPVLCLRMQTLWTASPWLSVSQGGPGRRSEGKRIVHHFPPLPTWAPCAWQPWCPSTGVLSFPTPVPTPVSRSHPVPTVQLPSTQASRSYQPVDALSILVCSLDSNYTFVCSHFVKKSLSVLVCIHFISSRTLIGIGPRVYGHLAKIEFSEKITQEIWKGHAGTFELVSLLSQGAIGYQEKEPLAVFSGKSYLYRVEQTSKQHTREHSNVNTAF